MKQIFNGQHFLRIFGRAVDYLYVSNLDVPFHLWFDSPILGKECNRGSSRILYNHFEQVAFLDKLFIMIKS